MDIDVLRECGKTVSFQNGQTICREGEAGHSMYVLLRGTVEIMINSFSDNVQSLGFMSEGSFFGEMSLLEDKPRSATIIAVTDDVLLMEISENDFPILLLNAPSIMYRLILTLNSRLNKMLDKIDEEDKRFVYQYRHNPLYVTIQKLGVMDCDSISKKDPAYVWELLKYLSSSLEKLNREYINRIK